MQVMTARNSIVQEFAIGDGEVGPKARGGFAVRLCSKPLRRGGFCNNLRLQEALMIYVAHLEHVRGLQHSRRSRDL